MQSFSWRVALAGAAFLAASAAFPSVSHADTFTIFTDNIGVDCSAGCGTVTVTDNGNNTYTFDVDLVPNTLVLHNTPGNPSAVAFNLAGVTALISSNSAGSTLSTNSPANGFGTFSFGVDCGTQTTGNICNPNGVSATGMTGTSFNGDFIFTVAAPSGEHLTNTTQGFPLALDVAQASAFGNTGFASVPGPVLGAGLPGLIAACTGLVALARRRRKIA